MKPIILAAFIVSMLLTFVGHDLFGIAPNRNNPKAKPQQGKPQQGKSQQGKPNGKKQNSQKQKTPEQRFREQQAQALEQQRKQATEQRRKQEAATAQRSKELQADKKRRNGLRLSGFKQEIQKSATSVRAMEHRLQPIRQKQKGLTAAITLTRSKAEGESVPQVVLQLEKMKRDLKTRAESTSDLAQELVAVKSACSKWSGSSNGSKEAAPSPATLSKLEEATLRIKRDCSRVDFELRKTETYHKTTTKTLFFCVSEMVRAGISFTSKEQDSIRALSD
jgi:hypothetical protein